MWGLASGLRRRLGQGYGLKLSICCERPRSDWSSDLGSRVLGCRVSVVLENWERGAHSCVRECSPARQRWRLEHRQEVTKGWPTPCSAVAGRRIEALVNLTWSRATPGGMNKRHRSVAVQAELSVKSRGCSYHVLKPGGSSHPKVPPAGSVCSTGTKPSLLMPYRGQSSMHRLDPVSSSPTRCCDIL